MERHNKRLLGISVVALLYTMLLTSCYYDNEEYLYPESAICDTENMSYANDVWPVINASCKGCHSGASPGGGIKLENYSDVAASAAIQAGNYGSLSGAINHASGNSPMPKNSDKLSDCSINKIDAWIEQGTFDN